MLYGRWVLASQEISHFCCLCSLQLHYKIKEKSIYSMAIVFLLTYILRHSCGLTFKVGKILPSGGGGHAVGIYLFIPFLFLKKKTLKALEVIAIYSLNFMVIVVV